MRSFPHGFCACFPFLEIVSIGAKTLDHRDGSSGGPAVFLKKII